MTVTTPPATTLINRALIRLSGEDVRGFLQGLVTNDVAGPLPVYAALLSAQGKCLFDFILWADGDDVLIDCERDAAGDLAKRLTLYRLRRPIAITLETNLCVHWALHDMGQPDPRLPQLGRRWLASPSGAAGVDAAYRAHRLSLGVTEGRAELGDGATLWLECNAAELNGVSFAKGCYVGQENTARMNWRSTVNRRMCIVPLDQADAKRQRVAYHDLGLSVEHRRVEDIDDANWRDWMGQRATAGD
ncbi:MAG: folate-binding protein [Sphingopyxis sp.]|nr:folate-binding protein [Sphingopyxis sp.]